MNRLVPGRGSVAMRVKHQCQKHCYRKEGTAVGSVLLDKHLLPVVLLIMIG